MHLILKARMRTLKLEDQYSSVIGFKIFEGEGKAARQAKIDVTIAAKAAEELRKRSGEEGVMFLTPGYDQKGREKQRKTERWIPVADRLDGTKPTREEVLLEAEKLGDTFGIQLMNDGKSFKIRASTEKNEEGWRQLQNRQPPPTKRYILNKIPGTMPNDRIIPTLKATLGWEAEMVGYPRVKGRGRKAFKSVTVKAHDGPTADTLQIGDFLVSINEDLAPDIRFKAAEDPCDFYGKVSEKRAAEIITKDEQAPATAKIAALAYTLAEKKQQTFQPLSYYSKAAPAGIQTPQGGTSATTETILKEAVNAAVQAHKQTVVNAAKTEVLPILQQQKEQQKQLDQKRSENEDLVKTLKGFAGDMQKQAAEMQRQQQAMIDQMQNQQAAINGWFLTAQKQFQDKITENIALTHKKAKTEDEELM